MKKWAGAVRFGVAVVTAAAVMVWPGGAIATGAGGQEALASLLDAYARGEHVAVLQRLAGSSSLPAIERDLLRRGEAWTTAGGAPALQRRRLVAATFALELTLFHLWPEEVDPLVEWGCRLLRKNGRPAAGEREWQRAAVAITSRARDDGRLVTVAGPGAPVGSRVPPDGRAVDHVAHARARFPDEPRFALAAAMRTAATFDVEPPRDAEWVADGVVPRDSWEGVRRAEIRKAVREFDALRGDPTVGAEAAVRLGYLHITLNEPALALTRFADVQGDPDPFVAYLARFLAGRAFDRLQQPGRAEAMYRLALETVPHAQSATLALAAHLVRTGRPDDAYALTQGSLRQTPPPADPWHLFGYGDLRFVGARLAELRVVIR